MDRFKEHSPQFGYATAREKQDEDRDLNQLGMEAYSKKDLDAFTEFWQRIDAIIKWWEGGVEKIAGRYGVKQQSDDVVQVTLEKLYRIAEDKKEGYLKLFNMVEKYDSWIHFICVVRKSCAIDVARKHMQLNRQWVKSIPKASRNTGSGKQGGIFSIDAPLTTDGNDTRSTLDTYSNANSRTPEDELTRREYENNEHQAFLLEKELYEVVIPSLPEVERKILTFYLEGMKLKDIAEMQDIGNALGLDSFSTQQDKTNRVSNTKRRAITKITKHFRSKVTERKR